MNLRWLWLDYIPPELGLTSAQKRHVRRKMTDREGAMTAAIIWVFVATVAIGFFSVAIANWVASIAPPALAPIVGPIAPIAIIALWWIGVAAARRRGSRANLQRALNDMGYRICRKCHYWLRGLDAAQPCPECGTRMIDPPRKLNIADLGNPEIVKTMHKLGYEVCFHCGNMTLDPLPGDPPRCPECGNHTPRMHDTYKT